MKLILLQHLSGAKAYDAGEEIEVTDQEALRFIKKGIAKAKTKKAHEDLLSKAEKLEKEESEKQAKLIAIQKESELKVEANLLLNDLLKIVDTLSSVNPEYRDEFLAKFQEQFVGEGKGE